MRGEANAHHMAGARWVGDACTVTAHRLVRLQGYPAMLAQGGAAVRGELYLVDERQLAVLDDFEGHPTLFVRRPVTLSGGGSAEAYCWAGDPDRLHAPVIAHGDWRRFREGRG